HQPGPKGTGPSTSSREKISRPYSCVRASRSSVAVYMSHLGRHFALSPQECYDANTPTGLPPSHGRPLLLFYDRRAANRVRRRHAMSVNSIGKFQVLGTLGTGAHSTILHIRRSTDSRNYALKVVPIDGAEDQKFLEQAQHEFRVAQMLDHPTIIKVYALE